MDSQSMLGKYYVADRVRGPVNITTNSGNKEVFDVIVVDLRENTV